MPRKSLAVNSRARFSIVPHHVLKSKLGATALRVYIALCGFANKRGYCYPSLKTIAELTLDGDPSFNRKYVSRAIQELKKAGLITVEPMYSSIGDMKSNGYKIVGFGIPSGEDTISPEMDTPVPSDEDTLSPDLGTPYPLTRGHPIPSGEDTLSPQMRIPPPTETCQNTNNGVALRDALKSLTDQLNRPIEQTNEQTNLTNHITEQKNEKILPPDDFADLWQQLREIMQSDGIDADKAGDVIIAGMKREEALRTLAFFKTPEYQQARKVPHTPADVEKYAFDYFDIFGGDSFDKLRNDIEPVVLDWASRFTEPDKFKTDLKAKIRSMK